MSKRTPKATPSPQSARSTRGEKPAQHRPRGAGREALLNAAMLEFEEQGYEGTNSNRIAARAGYAPQTFYRHFPDKLAIFLAVYADWSDSGIAAIPVVANPAGAAQALLDHHRAARVFRRSLRALTATEPRVADARARARRRQIAALAAASPRFRATPAPSRFAALLILERLADALADGEFEQMGLTEDQARTLLETELRARILPERAAGQPRPSDTPTLFD
jgi:AcrR family transcriptional regulator